MQMILILNNNIIMEQLFEQVHGGDHSAHLIEKLMLVPEHEVIIDTSPLTTVERNWNDITFIKRSEDWVSDTNRISIHITADWEVSSTKKVFDWATWKVEVDEER